MDLSEKMRIENSKLVTWKLGFSECWHLKSLSKVKTNFQVSKSIVFFLMSR